MERFLGAAEGPAWGPRWPSLGGRRWACTVVVARTSCTCPPLFTQGLPPACPTGDLRLASQPGHPGTLHLDDPQALLSHVLSDTHRVFFSSPSSSPPPPPAWLVTVMMCVQAPGHLLRPLPCPPCSFEHEALSVPPPKRLLFLQTCSPSLGPPPTAASSIPCS